jgi:plastocyanin
MRTLITALALLPATLGLIACGGDDDGGGGGGKAATFTKGQPVAIKGQEYSFDPGNVTIEGGGGQVEIAFENAGSLAHNVRIFKDGKDVGGSPTFAGGETKSATVDLQPGGYELICTVGDHADLGMKGKLTVK